MTLLLPPNMEALVSAYLRDRAEMTDLVGDRVYTALPKDVEFPAVRVLQLLDTPAGAPLYAVAFEIQVEAFGGSKGEAWRIASTARALLDAPELVGEHEGFGVVNGSTPGALLDLPDETFEPAKPRWLFTSTIYGRPSAIVPS
jgi:hypothetical protein